MEGRDVHALALKVMRMSRPALMSARPVTCEPQDLPGDALDAIMKESAKHTPELECFGLSEMLCLPSSLGNTYLYEEFTSFISVHNESKENVTDVVVKAEIQTGQNRTTLNKSSDAIAVLSPDGVIEEVVSHEVRDLCVHVLVCSVHYTMPSGDRKTFRKFFKFQVSKPVEVKTKFYNLRSNVFLEAHVQNMMQQPMHLQSVKLEPPKEYDAVDCNNTGQADSKGRTLTTFGEQTYLGFEEARQYLYKLVPKVTGGNMASRTATSVGRLDIVWRTAMGEVGHMQTVQLPRKPPAFNEAHLEVRGMPSRVTFGEPFTAQCKLINLSTQPVVWQLGFDEARAKGVLLSGLSDVELPPLRPQEEMDIALQFVPLELGLCEIRGVTLRNVTSAERVDISHFPAVFVEPMENN